VSSDEGRSRASRPAHSARGSGGPNALATLSNSVRAWNGASAAMRRSRLPAPNQRTDSGVPSDRPAPRSVPERCPPPGCASLRRSAITDRRVPHVSFGGRFRRYQGESAPWLVEGLPAVASHHVDADRRPRILSLGGLSPSRVRRSRRRASVVGPTTQDFRCGNRTEPAWTSAIARSPAK